MCSPEAKCNTLCECRKNNYLSFQSAAVHLLRWFVRCLGFGKNIRSRASWRQSMSASKQKRHECVCVCRDYFGMNIHSAWFFLLDKPSGVFCLFVFLSGVNYLLNWTLFLSNFKSSVIYIHDLYQRYKSCDLYLCV